MSASYLRKPRNGDWMSTFSGRKFWPLDPKPGEVFIEDIAHALSNQCRYGGHCARFYSVAEHSVWVSYITPPEFAFQGLMHDAAEAYCVDLPRPLKYSVPGYMDIEQIVWNAIAIKFDLPFTLHEEVKLADNRILISEKEELLPNVKDEWEVLRGLAKPSTRIMGYGPKMAEILFLNRFEELYHE